MLYNATMPIKRYKINIWKQGLEKSNTAETRLAAVDEWESSLMLHWVIFLPIPDVVR